jgi:hypothetical protein
MIMSKKEQEKAIKDTKKIAEQQVLESRGKMVEDYINTQKSVMDSVFWQLSGSHIYLR